MTLKGPENYYKRLEAYKGKDWEFRFTLFRAYNLARTKMQFWTGIVLLSFAMKAFKKQLLARILSLVSEDCFPKILG